MTTKTIGVHRPYLETSMKNYKTMEGESKNLENNSDRQSSDLEHDAGPILQPVRFRYSSVLADPTDWKFMGREFRFVLYCGIVLWTFHVLSMVV